MVIGTSDLTGGAPLTALAEEIIAEFETCGFNGIILDSGSTETPLLAPLARELCAALEDLGAPVFVTEPLGEKVPGAVVLVQTALSGGSFTRHLQLSIEKYGANRVALEVDRVMMDFPLPAYQGRGYAITAEELGTLRKNRAAFFTDSLCANYFTYRGTDTRHIVLFDDAASIHEKLAVGARLGISHAFLYYPHVRDILPSFSAF